MKRPLPCHNMSYGMGDYALGIPVSQGLNNFERTVVNMCAEFVTTRLFFLWRLC
jgi:hypothetical protein